MKLAHRLALLQRRAPACNQDPGHVSRDICLTGQLEDPLQSLGTDGWLCILDHVSTADLARLRAVNKQLKGWIDNGTVLRQVFRQYWQLAAIEGEPRSPNYYLSASLGHFVWRHRINASDTLSGVAVRHGVSTTQLKISNNLYSDHGLLSRTEIYVPVSSMAQLEGMHASFFYDPACSRQLLLVTDPHADPEAEGQDPKTSSPPAVKSEEQMRKIAAMVARGLKTDESTFRYYLEDAQGDLKVAIAAYEHDMRWESRKSGIVASSSAPSSTSTARRWLRR